MDIRLNWLRLKNFKGIKDYTLTIGGKNATIKSDNGKGKTTLEDAFLWLLFDKNSDNSARFSVKPLDENGQEIHFLETEVEAEMLVDGRSLRLKKVLTEDWVKPHGETERKFKGNKTAYFFDDVPAGANVYKSKVSELIDEETFKLITNPLYFNLYYKVGKLTDWQSRRNLLFEMCDNLTDEDVIAANPQLAKLPKILDGKSIDDRKVIISQSIRKLDEQIKAIGPKIDENYRLIPETPVDYTATEKQLKQLKVELDGIEAVLADASNAVNEYRKKHQEMNALDFKLESIKARIEAEANADRKRLIEERSRLEDERFNINMDASRLRGTIEQCKAAIERYSSERQNLLETYNSLRKEYAEFMNEQFAEPDGEDFVCPTCGQDLPTEAREEKLAEMQRKFEKNRNQKIAWFEAQINLNITEGKAIKKAMETTQATLDKTEHELAEKESRLNEIKTRLAEVQQELTRPPENPDYEADPEYKAVLEQAEKLIAEMTAPAEDTTAPLRQRKQEVMTQIEDCNRILRGRETVASAKARIEELMQSEKELSAQKSLLEGQLDTINLFNRAKADMLTNSMNAKFKHVRFKLFDIQQNGYIAECCETLINTNGRWVPYGDGNSAGRINAGIDIINALIDHYGVSAPIFVDNAESISELIPTTAQVIRLVKPEMRTDEDRQKYSKLIVEVEE